ncbi:hypothetical protein KY358_01255 [Candidatus Woesearchaeota archaeon]|nr:hypothetical protein [Candidatus Woesearchaeota archaeon]
MRIGFFEEFPTRESLGRLRMISFPSDVYIASASLSQFKGIREKIIKNKNVKDIIYWPTLKEEEGYWMSPFSKRGALKRVIGELKEDKERIKVLWDAELPLKRGNWKKELHNFFRNRKIIREFIKNSGRYNKGIITAEYPMENALFRRIFRFLALSFSPREYNHKKIGMLYTSMIENKAIKRYLERQIREGQEEYKENYLIGLGVIGKGIIGDEKQLKDEELKRDLEIAKRNRIKNVVIYRLGGLNKKRAEIIRGFWKG